MPLVFVFIGLLPFPELALKPQVRGMPAALRRKSRSHRECLRLKQCPC
jgi:hypothetical protein